MARLGVWTLVMVAGLTRPLFGQDPKDPKDPDKKPVAQVRDFSGKWTMPKLALLSFKDGKGYDIWMLTKLDLVLDDKGQGRIAYRKEQLGTKKVETGAIPIKVAERAGLFMIDSFQKSSWRLSVVDAQLSLTPTLRDLIGMRAALVLHAKKE